MVGKTSGATTKDSHAILMEHVGASVVERAMAKVPESERWEYENATSLSWIRCECVEQVYEAVAEEAGMSVEARQRHVVRAGVDRTFGTLWRLLLRFTTDNALITRTPLFYKRAFDTGKLESRMVDEGRAEIVMRGWREISDFHLRGLMLGIQCVLERAGRRNVLMRPTRTRDGVRIEASWTW